MAQENQDVQAEQLEAERKRRLALLQPATASWKLSQDAFRRIARTGEHAPASKQG